MIWNMVNGLATVTPFDTGMEGLNIETLVNFSQFLAIFLILLFSITALLALLMISVAWLVHTVTTWQAKRASEDYVGTPTYLSKWWHIIRNKYCVPVVITTIYNE